MRKILFSILCLCAALFLSSCGDDENVIKVGVIGGPEAELMQVAAQVAQKESGLKLKLIVFSDYLQPNTALNDGDIQANMFQHKPYLDAQVQQHGYQLVSVGKTFVYPMGLYSVKEKSLAALRKGAKVAIPNDPTNEGRAFLLLQKAGLIKLKEGTGLAAVPADIAVNYKDIEFIELDAADLARAYQDVDLAAINTNYAIPAGLLPSLDALFLESKDSPYANLIVVQQQDVNQAWVKQLVDAFQSEPVKQKADQLFKGQAIAAWGE